jgi:hypothetical protein
MVLIEYASDSEGPFTMVREKICEPITVCGASMCNKKETPDGKGLQHCSRQVFSYHPDDLCRNQSLLFLDARLLYM